MGAKSHLIWNGDAIKARLRKAQAEALEEVASRCVTRSRTLVRVRTGNLRDSITFQSVTWEGNRAVIRWGSFTCGYALAQEILTYSRSGHQPYLRPAAETEYPALAEAIRSHFQGKKSSGSITVSRSRRSGTNGKLFKKAYRKTSKLITRVTGVKGPRIPKLKGPQMPESLKGPIRAGRKWHKRLSKHSR